MDIGSFTCLHTYLFAGVSISKVKFNKLLEINEILGGNTDVVGPAREWVKEGKIVKISARDGSHRERYIFLVCNFVMTVG